MVKKVIKEKILKPLTKKIVDKLKKKEDLTRTERKAVRDHAKAKGKTTMEDGVKVTKYPYMGEAGETVAKRPRPKRRSDQINEMFKEFKKGGMLKKPTNPGLKKLPSEVRNKMGFMKKGGSVKGKCKVDGIAVRGRTKAKHK